MIGDVLRPDGSALERFTRDLTADARQGRLEPVRARDEEIARVIDILLRQGKNNPTLVGPAGVGKTAIAEGLAMRIAAGDVPLVLRDVRLLSLDHVSLLAGTTYRGQYEERIRVLVDEVTKAGNVILFIDELHNLIGQGTAMGTAMDAANMLKPALVRGDFRVIGATTGEEYTRWVLGDPALERRFQKVAVRELGDTETLAILQMRKQNLERHHNVVIADDAMVAAVRLTDRWVMERMRPDKAIDALDEACAHRQATTIYSPRAERLIRERMRLLRAKRSAEPAAPRRGASDDIPPPPPDPLVSALERFGAELEAMFAGGERPAHAAAPSPTPRPAPAPEADPSDDAPLPMSLGAVEAELTHQLSSDGVVVRGHDVARVVALMSGQEVRWDS